jgi:hypothetical protein
MNLRKLPTWVYEKNNTMSRTEFTGKEHKNVKSCGDFKLVVHIELSTLQ